MFDVICVCGPGVHVDMEAAVQQYTIAANGKHIRVRQVELFPTAVVPHPWFRCHAGNGAIGDLQKVHLSQTRLLILHWV